MPELPEVETMRRGLGGVVGARVGNVARLRCRLKPIHVSPSTATFRRRTRGQRITRTERVGKRVLVCLESDDAIVFEPRMTGLVLLADPPDTEHLRFRLDLEESAAPHLWYWDRRGLGSVRLLAPAQRQELFGPTRLGPDALQLSADQLRAQFCRSRRAIKVGLLDQKSLAGIGNLYASEILHVAGIHPQRRCHTLVRGEWQRIHAAMRAVLEAAIRHEGSTLSDGTYRNALNHPGSFQNHHRVYDRAGQLCPSCGLQAVTRIVQAQRATFYCRRCQPRSRPRRPRGRGPAASV